METMDSIIQPACHLLQCNTLGAYLKTRPPSSVVVLRASDTCGHALKTLATYGILSAPLYDDTTNEFIGWVDATLLLDALLGSTDVRALTGDNREYKLRSAGVVMQKSNAACA